MGVKVSPYQHHSVTDGKKQNVPRVGLRDESLKESRLFIFKYVMLGFVLITLSMFIILPIYWGSYFRQTENARRLTVLIVDLDSAAAELSSSALSPSVTTGSYSAILGPIVVSTAQTYIQRLEHVNTTYWTLGYVFPPQDQISQFSLPLKNADGAIAYTTGVNASEWAMDLVLDQTYWAVVIINGNATMQALNSVSDGGNSYTPTSSISYYYEESRNFYATNQYIATQLTQMLQTAVDKANQQHALVVLQQAAAGVGGGISYLTTADPSAVVGAFGWTSHNLRPFDQLGAEAPTTAGAIYLIIFTFLVSLVWNGAFGPFRAKLTMGSEVLLKVFVPIAGYFWISLMYSLVSLAFLVDFTRKYGHVGFFLYWMLCWITMIGLGLVMETMLEVLGQPYFSFFLVFWVIWNVSVAFLDLAQEAHFYSYGFAFPVWNNVDGTKSIMLGTKNHLAQNFLVNLAWAISFAIILALVTMRSRATATRKALREAEKKEHPNDRRFKIFF